MAYATQQIKQQIRGKFICGVYSNKELANKHGVSISTIYTWKKEYMKEFKEVVINAMVSSRDISKFSEFMKEFPEIISHTELREIVTRIMANMDNMEENRKYLFQVIKEKRDLESVGLFQ